MDNTKDMQGADLFEMILNGKVPKETVQTRRGKFVIRFPLPHELREIELALAVMLQGQPVSAFSNGMLLNFRVYATLDKVLVEVPAWWKKMEGAEKCPDDALITELYRRYLQFYSEIQDRLAGRPAREKTGEGTADNKDEAVVDGAFSGVTHGEEVPAADG